jgi:hypothetical protein
MTRLPFEVLVAALTIDAQLLQPAADRSAGHIQLRRQPVTQRPVGITQTKVLNRYFVSQSAPFKVTSASGLSFSVSW